MTSTAYTLSPISAADADRLRDAGGIAYVADVKPGFPCRQCLRDAEIGEALLLVSFDPFEGDSPYRCASPIFIHAQPCAVSPPDGDDLPAQLTGRQLSVRAFDTEAMMIDAAIVDGTDLNTTIKRFFADPNTHEIHVHNAGRGCWAVNVERASSEGEFSGVA